MFYCEKCRAEKDWPHGVLRSSGRCECCDEPALCHDVPSRLLPRPKDATRRGKLSTGPHGMWKQQNKETK